MKFKRQVLNSAPGMGQHWLYGQTGEQDVGDQHGGKGARVPG